MSAVYSALIFVRRSLIPYPARQMMPDRGNGPDVLYLVLLERLQNFLKGIALCVNVQVDRL